MIFLDGQLQDSQTLNTAEQYLNSTENLLVKSLYLSEKTIVFVWTINDICPSMKYSFIWMQTHSNCPQFFFLSKSDTAEKTAGLALGELQCNIYSLGN